MSGFEPVKATGNSTYWHGFNMLWNRTPGQIVPDPMRRYLTGSTAARIGMSSLGAGFTMWHVYSSYQEEGIWGAKDAAVWELATASAGARFAYGSLGTSGPSANIGWMARAASVGAKNPGTRIVFGGGSGMLGGMARFAGAGVGATVGQAVLGTPGAFIGGYVGAAPLRFAATHPLIAGGLAAVGVAAVGATAVVKGGSAVLRAGHQHRQNQRGIDTSGSMAAFMTQNAHTMRARAVQAMHKSHLNARSALGQEANFMHMPSKNYHSGYR